MRTLSLESAYSYMNNHLLDSMPDFRNFFGEVQGFSETPSPTPARKVRKSVQFFSLVKSYPHIHIDDMTEEEISSCWLTGREFSNIHKENAATLQRVLSGITVDEEDTEWCFRGLESKTPAGMQLRCMHRRASIMTVLEASRRRKYWNMAEMYAGRSLEARRIARMTAMMDARAVLGKPQHHAPRHALSDVNGTVRASPTPTKQLRSPGTPCSSRQQHHSAHSPIVVRT